MKRQRQAAEKLERKRIAGGKETIAATGEPAEESAREKAKAESLACLWWSLKNCNKKRPQGKESISKSSKKEKQGETQRERFGKNSSRFTPPSVQRSARGRVDHNNREVKAPLS